MLMKTIIVSQSVMIVMIVILVMVMMIMISAHPLR